MSNITQTSNLTAAKSTSIVVMVEGTRFWLSMNEISKFSAVFQGLFVDSLNSGPMQEGTTANPIVLHGIKRRDFAPLALWIRYGADLPNGRSYTEGDLLSMLHLADQWRMEDVEKFCFDGIWRLFGDPFFMLKLVTGYRRWDMLGELVVLATKVPLLDWKLQQVSIYEPIMRLRIRLDEVRRRCTAVPESIVQDDACTNHVMCTLQWKNAWRIHILERVFHPDDPLPLKQCPSVMAENSVNPNSCRRIALRNLRSLFIELDIEDDLYKDAENEIKAAFE
ncbi:hypothetical protein BJ165DRAFT_1399995 [Panaeolus papilionaceus]|nr:hypothetical protein BJ165DRAFT_1524966 [Panaeolus papilionaceus]KAF9054855.1 hypothetical protein BJ165DRAFT_1399995 [Panaeolus papilionaceus]